MILSFLWALLISMSHRFWNSNAFVA